jgi:hypothetical protein
MCNTVHWVYAEQTSVNRINKIQYSIKDYSVNKLSFSIKDLFDQRNNDEAFFCLLIE